MPEITKLAGTHDALPAQPSKLHPRFHVRAADLALLAKKITVGVVITAVPLVVVGGGLALTRALLHPHHSAAAQAARATHPNQGR